MNDREIVAFQIKPEIGYFLLTACYVCIIVYIVYIHL